MPKKEWTCQRELEQASKQKEVSFLFPYPLYRLPGGVAKIEGRSSHLERSGLKLSLPISDNSRKKKSIIGVQSSFG